MTRPIHHEIAYRQFVIVPLSDVKARKTARGAKIPEETTTNLAAPTAPIAPLPPHRKHAKKPRAPSKPDEHRRTDAIIQLLERKRWEFREQKRIELEERLEKSRSKCALLQEAHEKAVAKKKEADALIHQQFLVRSDAESHGIPATWKDTAWYREILAQEQKRRAHGGQYNVDAADVKHHHDHNQALFKLKRANSSCGSFGRLLTPGVLAFRDPVNVPTPESQNTFARNNSPTREGFAGLASRRKSRRKSRIPRKFIHHHARTKTAQGLPPIPIPTMTSISRDISLSQESKAIFEDTTSDAVSDPAARRSHYRFNRMFENVHRNKETAQKLLQLKGLLPTVAPSYDDDGQLPTTGVWVDSGKRGEEYNYMQLFADVAGNGQAADSGLDPSARGKAADEDGVDDDQRPANQETPVVAGDEATEFGQTTVPEKMPPAEDELLPIPGFAAENVRRINEIIVSASRRGGGAGPGAADFRQRAVTASAVFMRDQRRMSIMASAGKPHESAGMAQMSQGQNAGTYGRPSVGQPLGPITALDDQTGVPSSAIGPVRPSTPRSRSAPALMQPAIEDDEEEEEEEEDAEHAAAEQEMEADAEDDPESLISDSDSEEPEHFQSKRTSTKSDANTTSIHSRSHSTASSTRPSSHTTSRPHSGLIDPSITPISSRHPSASTYRSSNITATSRRSRMSSARPRSSGSGQKPRKKNANQRPVAPLTMAALIEMEGLKIAVPVVRHQRTTWTVV